MPEFIRNYFFGKQTFNIICFHAILSLFELDMLFLNSIEFQPYQTYGNVYWEMGKTCFHSTIKLYRKCVVFFLKTPGVNVSLPKSVLF